MKNILVLLMILSSVIGFSQSNKTRQIHYVKHNGKIDTIYSQDFNDYVRIIDSIAQSDSKSIKTTNIKVILNTELIKEEFIKLYLEYSENTLHITRKYGWLLDSMVICQINYLSKLDYITHEQDNLKFKTIQDRQKYYSPHIGYHKVYSEVIGRVSTYDNETEKTVSEKMFKIFLESKSHKHIIDDKNIKYYNFKFDYNKSNDLICVGVFN